MKILCVHPNYELYGSDRSFAMAVEALMHAKPDAEIDVLLPCSGPIITLSPFDRIAPRFREMWVLRRRGLLRRLTIGIFKNIQALRDARQDLNEADVVYVNTIIGIDFILMARFSCKPIVIHVREIPTGIELRVFRFLLLWSKAQLIFNSEATRQAFHLPWSIRSAVVYNGVADPGMTCPPKPESRKRIELLVIGRINHWKGQATVIDAVASLSPEARARIFVRIVGGTFNNQDDLRVRLQERIDTARLQETICIAPFEDDPSHSFMRADAVVVPSRLPEPFGRVAVEAMAHSRPVICSGHGGLVEIVEDGVTGRHFTPSHADDLTRVLLEILAEPHKLTEWGEASRRRYLERFTNAESNKTLLAALLYAFAEVPRR